MTVVVVGDGGRTVTGCADIKLTSGMWQLPTGRRWQDETVDDARNRQHQHHVERQDAVIRCNATDEQWTLRCRDNSWVGQLGNCSPAAAKRETNRRLLSRYAATHARLPLRRHLYTTAY